MERKLRFISKRESEMKSDLNLPPSLLNRSKKISGGRRKMYLGKWNHEK
jgi:hypothetical protein